MKTEEVEDLHFVLSHPESVAREMSRLRAEIKHQYRQREREAKQDAAEIKQRQTIVDAAILVAAHGPNALFAAENKSMLEHLREVVLADKD